MKNERSTDIHIASHEDKPGNHYQQYTVHEIEFIEKHYGSMPTEDIARHINRSPASVRNKAAKLGVVRSLEEFGWKADHDQILRETVPVQGVKAARLKLAEIGVERSRQAVERRSQKLGLRYHNKGSTFTFAQASKLSQPDFFSDIAATYKNRTGRELTYKELTEIAYVSHSRVQKWFAPGSGQQPLSLQMRHYLWLAVRAFKQYGVAGKDE